MIGNLLLLIDMKPKIRIKVQITTMSLILDVFMLL